MCLCVARHLHLNMTLSLTDATAAFGHFQTFRDGVKGVHTLDVSSSEQTSYKALECLCGVRVLNMMHCTQSTDKAVENLRGIHNHNKFGFSRAGSQTDALSLAASPLPRRRLCCLASGLPRSAPSTVGR